MMVLQNGLQMFRPVFGQIAAVGQQRPAQFFQFAVFPLFGFGGFFECFFSVLVGIVYDVGKDFFDFALCLRASSRRTTPRTSRPNCDCI